MTAEAWATPGDLRAHVEHLFLADSTRKLRLFNVACCRQLTPWFDRGLYLEVVGRVERLADAELRDASVVKSRQRVMLVVSELRRQRPKSSLDRQATVAQAVVSMCATQPLNLWHFDSCWRVLVERGGVFGNEFAQIAPALAHQLLLDIFGNPFRPVTFDPAWRTEAAVGLALRMYEDRDFRAMPILADALEEADCENADILTHCEPGVHVRGCWVVDLVLGKSIAVEPADGREDARLLRLAS